jgi:hypothetical protein
MRLANLVGLAVVVALVPLSELEAQRRCTKGIPCGNTCIAANKTCRIGSPPSRPAPSTPARAASAAPPQPASTEAKPSAPVAALGVLTEATSQSELAVPGVPGYVALDSTELQEAQAARLRALERARLKGRPDAIAPGSAPSAATPVGGASATAPEPSSATGLWVASRRGAVYYRAGCRGANALVVQNRIYFQSEQAAQAAGYRRSTAAGC